jgi:uridine kinase
MDTSIGLTPTLIGFSGGSGSGKTTLAAVIHERLGNHKSAVLSLDAYYKDLSYLPLEERASVNFDHPDALDVQLLTQQIRQLRCGHAVEVPRYDRHFSLSVLNIFKSSDFRLPTNTTSQSLSDCSFGFPMTQDFTYT